MVGNLIDLLDFATIIVDELKKNNIRAIILSDICTKAKRSIAGNIFDRSIILSAPLPTSSDIVISVNNDFVVITSSFKINSVDVADPNALSMIVDLVVNKVIEIEYI